MIQIQKKADQFNTSIFNGNFIVNKPVASGTKSTVKPYSNLFYWSHAIAIASLAYIHMKDLKL
jgi:hypothetical protein